MCVTMMCITPCTYSCTRVNNRVFAQRYVYGGCGTEGWKKYVKRRARLRDVQGGACTDRLGSVRWQCYNRRWAGQVYCVFFFNLTRSIFVFHLLFACPVEIRLLLISAKITVYEQCYPRCCKVTRVYFFPLVKRGTNNQT